MQDSSCVCVIVSYDEPYELFGSNTQFCIGTSDRPKRPFTENNRNRNFGEIYRKYRTETEKNFTYI